MTDERQLLAEALSAFKCSQNPHDYPLDHWSQRAEKLIARIAAPAADLSRDCEEAKKYRFLKKNTKQPHGFRITKYHNGWDKPINGDELDAAIDAARGRKP